MYGHAEDCFPRVEPDGQFELARVVADEGRECVMVDEELQVDATTHAGARRVEATVDVRSNTAAAVKTVCNAKFRGLYYEIIFVYECLFVRLYGCLHVCLFV